MKIIQHGINGKLNTDERISKIEDKAIETAQNETEEKKFKNKENVRSCGTSSSILTCVIGGPVEKRWRCQKILEQIIAKSFPNLMK